MPRFLHRIFSDKHLSFRREASTQDDVQQSRRVITKSATPRPETRLRARLSQLNLALHPENDGRVEDGASLAGSGAARPILAPSIASHECYAPAPKTKAPRRRLSKRHRTLDDSTWTLTSREACWPTASDWDQLNTTLSGVLIRATPPASVCFPEEPNYNEAACSRIRERWSDSTFHGADPVSIDYPIWTNDSCNPIYANGTSITGDPNAGERGCNADTYPAYVVNATRSEQVAAALKWADARNIRVIVKATGHSYTGRSTGPSSLSIWTHNFRGLEYIAHFAPTACPASDTYTAVRIAAGHTGGEIQEYLSTHGKITVTGANPSVGIIGWLTGGGHGFLSSTYGMGSDNLLEARIVLPNGSTITTNPCLHAEIFSAIRGGGGSTFGVLTEVVLRTHPTPQTTLHVFNLTSLPATSDTDFWATVGFLHTQMPALKRGGMQGYYYIVGPPTFPSLSLFWAFILFNKPADTATTLLAPIVAYLAARPSLFAHSTSLTHAPTYHAFASHISNEAVATGGSTYGSRLLSPRSLSDANTTAVAFHAIGPHGNATSHSTLIGHMVAPDFPPSYHPEAISLNPAWRAALSHLIVVSGWRDGASRLEIERVYADITARTQVLRELSPETGAYFNEADSREVDWQESFFGDRYEELLRLKRRVDPGSVLWCRRCVGSEVLEERDGGKLCARKRSVEGNTRGRGKGKSELRP
ncbi:hypothetical protein OPT61_g1202 [Boeremia exigua]|uniref:Uncharacterized protein n=1 Tax=Boeremia exigua TaxID=749465 RepID=A0ACC2IR77_9PLEO|nr:hypothetical protein OPT61_g1202 [Boeremia exigua]